MHRARVLAVAILLAACSRPSPHMHPGVASETGDEAKLQAVIAIHGGAGPWAVAGYRMGEHARAKLDLARGSFDLEVTHFTPREVQYSCVADGAAAATGASLGKLNLTLTEAAAAETRTMFRKKSTGQAIVLRLTDAFKSRFLDIPRDRHEAATREVLRLRDEEIFELVPHSDQTSENTP